MNRIRIIFFGGGALFLAVVAFWTGVASAQGPIYQGTDNARSLDPKTQELLLRVQEQYFTPRIAEPHPVRENVWQARLAKQSLIKAQAATKKSPGDKNQIREIQGRNGMANKSPQHRFGQPGERPTKSSHEILPVDLALCFAMDVSTSMSTPSQQAGFSRFEKAQADFVAGLKNLRWGEIEPLLYFGTVVLSFVHWADKDLNRVPVNWFAVSSEEDLKGFISAVEGLPKVNHMRVPTYYLFPYGVPSRFNGYVENSLYGGTSFLEALKFLNNHVVDNLEQRFGVLPNKRAFLFFTDGFAANDLSSALTAELEDLENEGLVALSSLLVQGEEKKPPAAGSDSNQESQKRPGEEMVMIKIGPGAQTGSISAEAVTDSTMSFLRSFM